MDRRHFIGVSAAGLACTALLVVDEEDGLKPREPDLVIERHGGVIAFSPDSKVLAVASGPIGDSYGVCFLDTNTGKRLPDFEQTTDVETRIGDGRPQVLAFSKDGKHFAAGGEGYVALWDAKNGRRLKNLEPMADREWGTVVALDFTPDSKYLFAGVGFWPLEPLGAVEKLEELKNYEAVAFSPDEQYFITRFQGLFELWEYSSRRRIRQFGVQQPTGGFLEFFPDSKRIVSGLMRIQDRPHYVWNVSSGETEFITFSHHPAFDLSPDGSLLTAVVRDGVALLRVTDGSVALTLNEQSRRRKGENPVTGIKFSSDKALVAHARSSGIRTWKEKNGFKA